MSAQTGKKESKSKSKEYANQLDQKIVEAYKNSISNDSKEPFLSKCIEEFTQTIGEDVTFDRIINKQTKGRYGGTFAHFLSVLLIRPKVILGSGSLKEDHFMSKEQTFDLISTVIVLLRLGLDTTIEDSYEDSAAETIYGMLRELKNTLPKYVKASANIISDLLDLNIIEEDEYDETDDDEDDDEDDEDEDEDDDDDEDDDGDGDDDEGAVMVIGEKESPSAGRSAPRGTAERRE